MSDASETKTHKFTTAGLGVAPFRFRGLRDTAAGADENGMVRRDIGGFEVLTKPGGTCAYCGMAITVLCYLESADGNRFHVGTTCVEKAGDKGLIRKVKTAANKRNRARQLKRERARIAAARAVLETEFRSELEALPHSDERRARDGHTMADEVSWYFEHAGHTGQLKMTRRIEKIQKGKG